MTIIDKTKILIVEDDSFLAGIYAGKFESEGFKVSLATDGELGLKLAKKELPNIILLDVLLPKLDGFEVLEKLKANATTRVIPVVLLTNLGQKEDVERGFALGAADYLIKAHFMPAETIEKVKKVLAAGEK
ncbi:MAG: response regulator [bacterium]|nr:response regulator [bacterium]